MQQWPPRISAFQNALLRMAAKLKNKKKMFRPQQTHRVPAAQIGLFEGSVRQEYISVARRAVVHNNPEANESPCSLTEAFAEWGLSQEASKSGGGADRKISQLRQQQ